MKSPNPKSDENTKSHVIPIIMFLVNLKPDHRQEINIDSQQFESNCHLKRKYNYRQENTRFHNKRQKLKVDGSFKEYHAYTDNNTF